MKGAIIHGLLLVVMLAYGYRTWTADKTVPSATVGSVVLWDKREGCWSLLKNDSPITEAVVTKQPKNYFVRLVGRCRGSPMSDCSIAGRIWFRGSHILLPSS